MPKNLPKKVGKNLGKLFVPKNMNVWFDTP